MALRSNASSRDLRPAEERGEIDGSIGSEVARTSSDTTPPRSRRERARPTPVRSFGGWGWVTGRGQGEGREGGSEGSWRDDGSLDRIRTNSGLITVQLVRFHRTQVVIENQRSS